MTVGNVLGYDRYTYKVLKQSLRYGSSFSELTTANAQNFISSVEIMRKKHPHIISAYAVYRTVL